MLYDTHQAGLENPHFQKYQLVEAFTDVRCLLMVPIAFLSMWVHLFLDQYISLWSNSVYRSVFPMLWVQLQFTAAVCYAYNIMCSTVRQHIFTSCFERYGLYACPDNYYGKNITTNVARKKPSLVTDTQFIVQAVPGGAANVVIVNLYGYLQQRHRNTRALFYTISIAPIVMCAALLWKLPASNNAGRFFAITWFPTFTSAVVTLSSLTVTVRRIIQVGTWLYWIANLMC